MPSKTVRVTVVRDGAMCFVPVPFDPKRVFGRVRAPVRVTLNGFTYRSTIASMGGTVCIPLRRSDREAAGLQGNETLAVEIALDTVPESKAVHEVGLFGQQNTVCRPTTPQWRHTVERLKTYFRKWDQELRQSG